MELHRQHREGQSKYTYFLLAASASAIAFAMHKTTGSTFNWYQIPLGGAILFWALSFYFGCKNVEWVQTSVLANQALLNLYEGQHPYQPNTLEETEVAIEGTRDALGSNIENAKVCGVRQFRFLITGAVLFITWHLLEMYKTTKGI